MNYYNDMYVCDSARNNICILMDTYVRICELVDDGSEEGTSLLLTTP